MTESIARVTRSVISGPDTQAAIWFLGALSQLRVTGDQTGGALAVADHLARRGNASPVHVHDRDDAATGRTTGLRRAGPGRRAAPDHDLGSAAPALEPHGGGGWLPAASWDRDVPAGGRLGDPGLPPGQLTEVAERLLPAERGHDPDQA